MMTPFRLVPCTLALLVLTSLGAAAQRTPASSVAPTAPTLPEGLLAPGWEAGFGAEPGLGGLNDGPPLVLCSAVYDDGLGDGPVLYVGGSFESAGGRPAQHLARWDGSEWTGVGDANLTVYAMAVHDDGTGEQLYVGGAFTAIGGAAIPYLARFDGTNWSPVGAGVNARVSCLYRFLDGGAEYLGVGGDFTTAGGSPASHAALYLGASWFPFGDGFDDAVNAFVIHDLEIYAGGEFSFSGGTAVSHLARWTGSAWEDVDGGTNADVRTLASWGTGSAHGLYVGGFFTEVGGTSPVSALRLARWQAGSWAQVGGGLLDRVEDLAAWDDGGGEDLYVAGRILAAPGISITQNVVRWDGTDLSSVGGGLDAQSFTLAVHDDGSGESLWIGGQFKLAGGVGADGVARWDGTDWSPAGYGLNDRVWALHASTTFLGGPTLFVGGEFATPGTAYDRGFAAWQPGTGWIPLGAIGTTSGDVYTIVEFDDGGGPKLYVGGSFTSIGGVAANRLAVWDGVGWSAMGGGLNGTCRALAVWDDGGGPKLYAGGSFTTAGGTPAARIARWNGAGWSALGGGLNSNAVHAMQGFDDGSGPVLFVTGSFNSAGGVPAQGVARWDGGAWSDAGGGLSGMTGPSDGIGTDLELYDDGCGPRLFLGGTFTVASGVTAHGIARWNGTTWSPIGNLSFGVQDLQAFDDGLGPSLFAAGSFDLVNGAPAGRIARYNGAGWATLGAGLSDEVIHAMVPFDDGIEGERLVVGGNFSVVPDLLPTGASRLAWWNGQPGGFTTWTDLGFALAGVAGDPLLQATGALSCGSTVDLDLSNAAPSALSALFVSFASTPTPFAGGTLVPVPWLGPYYFTTSGLGTLPLSFVMPTALPPGSELFLQWVITDTAAVAGKALSNALLGEVP